MSTKNIAIDSSSSPRNSLLIEKIAQKYAIDPNEIGALLKATAFKQVDQITNEQMDALLIVCDQYDLNPFIGEVKAYQDSRGGIIPVVGIDGWNRIANSHPQFDGVEFVYSDTFVELDESNVPCHTWIEVVVHRKDRAHPIRVKEYIDECYRVVRDPMTGYVMKTPWQTHPKRSLRHKTQIQGYRIGLSMVGIYDEDEAQRILAAQREDTRRPAPVVPITRPMRSASPAASSEVAELAEPKKVVTPANETIVKPECDKAELDEFVMKLVNRCKVYGQWNAALSLCKERLNKDSYLYAAELLAKYEKLAADQSSIVVAGEETCTVQPVSGSLADETSEMEESEIPALSSNVDF